MKEKNKFEKRKTDLFNKKDQFSQTGVNTDLKDGKNKHKGKVLEIRPTMLVLATYILLLISKFIDIALLNRDNEYMSVIILQMMIFLLPGSLWCMLNGEKYIKGLRISAPKPQTFLLIISSALLMISGALLISLLFSGIDTLSDNFSLYDTFISKKDGSVSNAFYLVIAYAALPALCEEFVYRGILCYEYEKGGAFRAIVISSLFFAMLHFNLGNLLVYLFCGGILVLTLYATRSLWGAVIAHFLYNLFGVFGQPYMASLYKFTKNSGLLMMIIGIVFFISATLFCSQASKLYKIYLRNGITSSYRKNVQHGVAYFREGFFDVIKDPITIACFVIYIVAVVVLWL